MPAQAKIYSVVTELLPDRFKRFLLPDSQELSSYALEPVGVPLILSGGGHLPLFEAVGLTGISHGQKLGTAANMPQICSVIYRGCMPISVDVAPQYWRQYGSGEISKRAAYDEEIFGGICKMRAKR